MSARVIEKIEEFQHRKIGVVVELSALGTAIEHCLRVACAVQSKFKNGLHQVLDSSIHATRKTDYGQTRESLSSRTRLDENAVDNLLRFEEVNSRTHEGKFNFLI